MIKRILSITAILLLICSVIWSTPELTFATVKQPPVYMSIYSQGDRAYREKIGSYYIWTVQKGNTSYLKCAKSASSKGKTLHKVKGSSKWISQYMASNGTTVYYAVNEETKSGAKAVIYRASVNGKKSKVKSIPAQTEIYGYDKGKLYYGADESLRDNAAKGKLTALSTEKTGAPGEKHFGGLMNLYYYDTGKKSTKLLIKGILGESSYGAYLTYVNMKNGKQYLYHVAAKKSIKLPKAQGTEVYGNKIYYYNETSGNVTVKTCSLTGKKVRKIKTLEEVRVDYLGRKAIYFSDYNTGKRLKMNYASKKITTAK